MTFISENAFFQGGIDQFDIEVLILEFKPVCEVSSCTIRFTFIL